MLSCQRIRMAFLSASLCKAVFLQCATCGHRQPFVRSLFTVEKWGQFACLDAAGVQRTWGCHTVKCRNKMLKMENGRESAQKSCCKLIYPTCTMSFHITHQIMHCISHHTTSCYNATHQITHHLIHDMVHHIIHHDVVTIIYIIATSHVIIVAAMIIVW